MWQITHVSPVLCAPSLSLSHNTDICNSDFQTMKTVLNPASNPSLLLTTNFPLYRSTSVKPFRQTLSFLVKCNLEDSDNGSLKNALSGMVDKRVEELLNKEENRGLLNGLEKATIRVERAKMELAEIKRQEIEAAQMRKYVDYLETRKNEIAECQKEMSEARAMAQEAERSLSANLNSVASEDGEIDKDQERLESVKAASVSTLVGTLAGLPLSLSQVSTGEQLILPLAISAICCALFGVTYRYTMRRDLDDVHLKSGVSAAFSFAKGLGALETGPPLELSSASFLSHTIDGAVLVSENLLVFVFAAVALDFSFKMQLLSPFPIRRSSSPKN